VYKSMKDGVINFGEEIELTEEDLAVLEETIIDSQNTPVLRKVDGMWIQQAALDSIGTHYNIFVPDEYAVSEL